MPLSLSPDNRQVQQLLWGQLPPHHHCPTPNVTDWCPSALAMHNKAEVLSSVSTGVISEVVPPGIEMSRDPSALGSRSDQSRGRLEGQVAPVLLQVPMGRGCCPPLQPGGPVGGSVLCYWSLGAWGSPSRRDQESERGWTWWCPRGCVGEGACPESRGTRPWVQWTRPGVQSLA